MRSLSRIIVVVLRRLGPEKRRLGQRAARTHPSLSNGIFLKQRLQPALHDSTRISLTVCSPTYRLHAQYSRPAPCYTCILTLAITH